MSAADRKRDAVLLHDPGPAGPEAVQLRVARSLRGEPPALLLRQHPHADDPEQRRDQRDRGRHRDEHDDRRGDRDAVEEADTEHEQAEQRHDDGPAREQHRPAGRVQRAYAGRLWIAARRDRVAVAGHDEQRIVDPDAEADERGERGRERRDVDRMGEQTGEAQAAPEREHRGDQRQQRRPQRAERDREHDRCREEADELARAAALLPGWPAGSRCRRAPPAGRRRARPPRCRSACRRRTSGRRRSAARRPCARWRTPPCRPWRSGAPPAPSANGLSTRSTCGPLAIASSVFSIRALVAGSLTSSAAKTTWLVSVDSVLKLSVSRFRAVVDSVPGSENESV